MTEPTPIIELPEPTPVSEVTLTFGFLCGPQAWIAVSEALPVVLPEVLPKLLCGLLNRLLPVVLTKYLPYPQAWIIVCYLVCSVLVL